MQTAAQILNGKWPLCLTFLLFFLSSSCTSTDRPTSGVRHRLIYGRFLSGEKGRDLAGKIPASKFDELAKAAAAFKGIGYGSGSPNPEIRYTLQVAAGNTDETLYFYENGEMVDGNHAPAESRILSNFVRSVKNTGAWPP
jgi:hypothetical protein